MRTIGITHAKQVLAAAVTAATLLCAAVPAAAHSHDSPAARADRTPRFERAHIAPHVERRIEAAPRVERRIEAAPRVERRIEAAPRVERRIEAAPRVERAHVAPRIERRVERAQRLERQTFEQRVSVPREVRERAHVTNSVPFVEYVYVPVQTTVTRYYTQPYYTQPVYYSQPYAATYYGTPYAYATPYDQCLYSDNDGDENGYCAAQAPAYYNDYAPYGNYGPQLQQLQGIVVAKSGTMLMVLGANGLQPIFVNATPAYQNGFAAGTPSVGQIVNAFGYYNGDAFVATALE